MIVDSKTRGKVVLRSHFKHDNFHTTEANCPSLFYHLTGVISFLHTGDIRGVRGGKALLNYRKTIKM